MVAHCSELERREGMTDEVIDTVLSTVDMQEVLERTGTILRRYFGETRVSIHRLVDDDPSLIEIVYVADPKVPQEGVGRRIPIEGSVCGEAVTRRMTIVAQGLGASLERYHEARFLAPLGYQALASIPLIVEDRVLGTLDVAHGLDSTLLSRCLQDAEQVARLLAIALNNSLMVDEVRRLNRLLDRENTALKREIDRSHEGQRYIATGPLMRAVMSNVELVAGAEMTVLIRGETGTGKEGLARAIHERSQRKAGPFVVVNLAAIPDQLIESELFGHEKGAFTGAIARREGFFETAAGGTLFLDEVGDAPLSVQVRLMRALQEHEITRVGSSVPIPVDVRVVAATNRPLEAMIKDGSFRSDLYYRLNIFPINLPPLRERREEIRPLVEYLVTRYAAVVHRRAPEVAPAEMERLEAYDWPGNIRELESTILRTVILSRGDRLEVPDLPGTVPTTEEPIPAPLVGVPRFDAAVRSLLVNALEAAEGRIYGPRGAAALLGLKPTTLQGKLRRFRIDARSHRR